MARRRPAPARPALVALLALLALGAATGCTVVPAQDRGRVVAPEAGEARAPRVDPAYVRAGPIPPAALSAPIAGRGFERFDVALPSKAPPGAPPEAAAPIRLRWWRPSPSPDAPARRPAVVVSPILGSETAFVTSFAERFAREGWHALVVFRPEVAYDPRRPFSQVEARIADGVARRVEALDWLLARDDVDPARIASFGISAGGIEGALVAGADRRYRAHVLGLAGGPLADVFVDSEEDDIRRVTDVAARALCVTREALRARLREEIRTDPVRLAPRVDPASVLLVLARLDRSVPARHGRTLREALGRPATIYLPLGHYASVLFLPFVEPRVVEFLRRRFEGDRNGAPPGPPGTFAPSPPRSPP